MIDILKSICKVGIVLGLLVILAGIHSLATDNIVRGILEISLGLLSTLTFLKIVEE